MSGKPIHELTRSECRYPITPDHALKHLFCAEPVEGEGFVYCAEHAKLCYDRRPAERRREDAVRAAIARSGLRDRTGMTFRMRPAMAGEAGAITVAEHLK